MATSNPLLLPVGYYLGRTSAAPDALAEGHLVRVGGRQRRLPAGPPYLVWLLAHGVAVGAQPWRPADIVAASALAPGVFDDAVAGLVDDGLMVAVDPEGPEAEAMARAYRWQSMLCGHGMRPEWQGRYGIGLPTTPWALVTNVVHDVWRWAPVVPTLWDACEALTEAYRDPPGEEDVAVDDPHEMLRHVFASLQHLLVCSAGFLDEAW